LEIKGIITTTSFITPAQFSLAISIPRSAKSLTATPISAIQAGLIE
jgi:hypothetical protein